MKRILFFGTYNPDYPRNRLLRRWTSEVARVTEINVQGRGLGKYLRLARSLWKQKDYDAIVVAFPGHMACILARCISRKKIIFDAFISIYDTYVFDRATVKLGSLRAWYYWCIDWLAFHAASIVVIDTDEHAEYLNREFKIPKDRIQVVPVVTDVDLFRPMQKAHSEKKIIWWHGKYSRLHNVRYIIEVASLMKNEKNIVFHLLGSGGNLKTIRAEAETRGLSNVVFLPPTAYEKLPQGIATADVCLGVFGMSDKVDRVVPNKIYEYLACGKPVVTRKSLATERVCKDLPIRYVGNLPEDAVRAIHELLQLPIDVQNVYARVRSLCGDAEKKWKSLL